MAATTTAALQLEITKLKNEVKTLKKCCKDLKKYLVSGYVDKNGVPIQGLDAWTKQVTNAMHLVDFVCLSKLNNGQCGGPGGNVPKDPPTWPPT